jgi:septal ring factor EnvC (AmiA/AmiB activator)
MSESSKVTLSVEELINLTAHAATQEQLNDTRKELDQKIEAVRHELSDKIDTVRNELSDKIDTVRNEVSSLKNLIIATAFVTIATVAGAAFWVGSHINV